MSESRIRVLHFTNTTVYAGAEEHMLTLLRGLDRHQFQPFLACHPKLYKEMEHALPADVRVLWTLLERPEDCRAAIQFTRILREHRIQILHSHMFQSSLVASPLAWMCRVPAIIETPHVAERWRNGWLKGNFQVDRLISRFVTYHIAVSRANAKYLVQTKGLPQRKVVVIRNGCDPGQFTPDRPEPAGLRKSLGFGKSDPVLIVPARLEPQKGHSIFLSALPSVIKEFPQLKAVLVGDGILRKDLEAQAASLGLNPNIRFVGYQSKIADWYALADLMVLPSLYEGLPLVAIEALSSGCPVVATAVDGTPEVVIHGKSGLTVPPRDPIRLAEAICQMFRQPEMRESMGRCGREFIMSEFTLAKQVRETADIYRLAWNQRRRGDGDPRRGESSIGTPSHEAAALRH